MSASVKRNLGHRPRRRLLLWALGGLVTAAAVGVSVRLWVFPHYRPHLGEGEVYGVDVSNHQGDIDWRAVAADDVEFAYIKATEGGDFVDRRFEENWKEAGAAGVGRGAYHFFTLCRSGADQARNFLRTATATLAEAELPPALDLELGGNCRARPPVDQVNAEIDAFVELVEREARRKVVLYVLDNWEDVYSPPQAKADRPKWVRRVAFRPSGNWAIWQYTGVARVDGVRGPVDLNVMRPAVLHPLTAD